jgi:enamine deaminase RidA (YjgF/YER057c/UK114 family)
MTTHRRIRPFNTKDTYPEQQLSNDLCQAVVANGVVYLRGQVAQDLDTREDVGIGDPAAQAHQVMDNIEPVYRVLGERMPGVFPVFTGLVVVALARPTWLVEVDITAVIPAGDDA